MMIKHYNGIATDLLLVLTPVHLNKIIDSMVKFISVPKVKTPKSAIFSLKFQKIHVLIT